MLSSEGSARKGVQVQLMSWAPRYGPVFFLTSCNILEDKCY